MYKNSKSFPRAWKKIYTVDWMAVKISLFPRTDTQEIENKRIDRQRIKGLMHKTYPPCA
jgi:hypothetical protein